uniref:Uncharacterized protein n=1 Tax=Timema genevievae TaxID=629358 RepID=A0A7R9JNM3_TIMGE|nr:unnamed protein product [Timema genevievae]
MGEITACLLASTFNNYVLPYLVHIHSRHLKWEAFKSNHNKNYTDEEEHDYRMRTFFEKLDYIEEHNDRHAKGHANHKVEINKFADHTKEEVHDKYCGYKRGDLDTLEIKKVPYKLGSTNELPTNFDWRDYGYVTPVRDQGSCGACWAFSAVSSPIRGGRGGGGSGTSRGEGVPEVVEMSALECLLMKERGSVNHLSEQWLIDCSDMNCNGGWMASAYDFMMSKEAVVEDKSYPYTAAEAEACRNFSNNVNTSITGVCMIEPYNEEMLMHAVYTKGCICVALNGSPDDFHHYKTEVATSLTSTGYTMVALSCKIHHSVTKQGKARINVCNVIISPMNCYDPSGVYTNYKDCDPNNLTHAATLCGFGTTEDGVKYWLLKNSWGTDWGEEGYVRVGRQNNTCGITTAPSCPLIKDLF